MNRLVLRIGTLFAVAAFSFNVCLAQTPAAAEKKAPAAKPAATAPKAPKATPKAVPGVPAMPEAPTTSAIDVSKLPIVTLDRIVVVVNNEAITQYEVDKQKVQVLRQMKAAKVTPPPERELDRQLIERMIAEKALMQFARQAGIRVDDNVVQRAIGQIAAENKVTPEQLMKAVEKEGLTPEGYRNDLRRQITFQRLREREVDSHVVVTDAEVNSFLAMVEAQSGSQTEYLISHILVAVPDQASPQVIAQRQARAEGILKRLNSGENFAEAAAAMSDAPDALNGGSLGWRTLGRLPGIFAQEVGRLQKGQHSGLLRSPAGFHIIELANVRDSNAPTVIEQTHARHILTKVNESQSEDEAYQKILRAQQRLRDGESFTTVAKLVSEDLSSSKGGDLGWLSPGDTVPDFERAMKALPVGGVSDIVRSPFGWHIIQVVERRKQDVTQERKRIQARNALAQRKAEEMFDSFARQTRDNAYVEYKVKEF